MNGKLVRQDGYTRRSDYIRMRLIFINLLHVDYTMAVPLFTCPILLRCKCKYDNNHVTKMLLDYKYIIIQVNLLIEFYKAATATNQQATTQRTFIYHCRLCVRLGHGQPH